MKNKGCLFTFIFIVLIIIGIFSWMLIQTGTVQQTLGSPASQISLIKQILYATRLHGEEERSYPPSIPLRSASPSKLTPACLPKKSQSPSMPITSSPANNPSKVILFIKATTAPFKPAIIALVAK